jgi:hypothetical protein
MEKHEQIAVIGWASHKPLVRDHLIAIPNGGYRNVKEAASLKRQGVKRGVSDLFLALPAGEFSGLWIEMKSEKGRLTKEQIEWLERMEKVGYATCVAYSAEAAITAIEAYMKIGED